MVELLIQALALVLAADLLLLGDWFLRRRAGAKHQRRWSTVSSAGLLGICCFLTGFVLIPLFLMALFLGLQEF
jgi:hypothetical protein